ncbi:MAG: precorrin-8X methylmutase, partial [Dehalococcoidales bacterium]|nr:precorrin-8X methylmutase [Dehalococcoidales bacterium]
MVDNGGIEPALVIGMPVGFVRAAESKAELVSRSVPYITIEGTRGGSALAATTVNALIGIYDKQRKSASQVVINQNQ